MAWLASHDWPTVTLPAFPCSTMLHNVTQCSKMLHNASHCYTMLHKWLTQCLRQKKYLQAEKPEAKLAHTPIRTDPFNNAVWQDGHLLIVRIQMCPLWPKFQILSLRRSMFALNSANCKLKKEASQHFLSLQLFQTLTVDCPTLLILYFSMLFVFSAPID